MSDGETPRRAESAGGVVYRRRGARVEVVLVARTDENLWALPKGTLEPGETPEQAALREVSEETGLRVTIVGSVGDDRYWFTSPNGGVRVDKVVHHYLMEAHGGDLSLHDGEFDLAGWFDINEACRRLTYPSQRRIVERAFDLIDGLAGRPSGGPSGGGQTA